MENLLIAVIAGLLILLASVASVELGVSVAATQANFVWCRHETQPAKPTYEELKRRMILVRYMNYEGYGDGLRITVGTDEEIDRLLAELRSILGRG